MRTVIAYALVVVGIPIFVGQLFGVILNMPITLIIGMSRRGRETPTDATEAIVKEPIHGCLVEAARR